MTRLILRLTHRMWNRVISAILCRSHAEGIIDSRQLHLLAAKFDPTQRHKCYALPLIVCLLLIAAPANAQQWCRQALPCQTCKVAPPVIKPQTSTVNTSSNSLTITNYYQFSQPAAAQGDSIYGFNPAFVSGYRDQDLGALMTQYARYATDGQAGQLAIGSQLGNLIGLAGDRQAKIAETLAIGHAGSQLANAVKAPASNVKTQITYQGPGNPPADNGQGFVSRTEDSFRTLATDSLTYQACGKCHVAGREGVAKWKLDEPLSAERRIQAMRAIINKTMPKGGELTPDEIGTIIKEFAL